MTKNAAAASIITHIPVTKSARIVSVISITLPKDDDVLDGN
jgi:hypothetical protein